MALENSGYLWLLLLIPFYLYFFIVSRIRAQAWLYRFAHTKRSLMPSVISMGFLSLACSSVILSLTEPKVQYNKIIFNRGGIDLVMGIDVSKSMLAEDEMIPEEGRKLFVIPNRLNRARYSALNIITALRGERVAVFMFASKGIEVIPPTTDYGYCQYILKHISDTAITIPGSNLSEAIMTGMSLLEDGSRKRVKAIILISDGEDISADTSQIYESAQRAATQGITIYTVGTGMGQGVLIPIRDTEGTAIVDYYQDEDGTYLKTRLEQDTLKSIATITGGRYFKVDAEHSEDNVVEAILQHARTIEYTKAIEPAWFYVSPVLLFVALVFFIIGINAAR